MCIWGNTMKQLLAPPCVTPQYNHMWARCIINNGFQKQEREIRGKCETVRREKAAVCIRAINEARRKETKTSSQDHTMDLLWEKFQWILPLYMKPISFQSKASVVCSVTAAIIIGFCLKKLNLFPNILVKKQMNIWILQNKSPGIEMLTNFLC